MTQAEVPLLQLTTRGGQRRRAPQWAAHAPRLCESSAWCARRPRAQAPCRRPPTNRSAPVTTAWLGCACCFYSCCCSAASPLRGNAAQAPCWQLCRESVQVSTISCSSSWSARPSLWCYSSIGCCGVSPGCCGEDGSSSGSPSPACPMLVSPRLCTVYCIPLRPARWAGSVSPPRCACACQIQAPPSTRSTQPPVKAKRSTLPQLVTVPCGEMYRSRAGTPRSRTSDSQRGAALKRRSRMCDLLIGLGSGLFGLSSARPYQPGSPLPIRTAKLSRFEPG